ncbi:glycosyltransferase family 4 protein [Thomasclavelia spiroformis]|uniref:glycosyltransferase family 4 protein n=1 Tax=Thomasclavelia spiroformis TaxID=29348 RepID=UPI0039A12AE7
MKIRFFSNIPSPYRIDFFNMLGKKVDLEVIFEAEKAPIINNKWYSENAIKSFKAVFLKKGTIEEKKVNFRILQYVNKTPDLLIFTNYSYYTEMIGLICAKIRRLKYALMIDGGMISKKESSFKKLMKTFLISGADLYFSPSRSSDDFLLYYGAEMEKIKRYPFTSLKKEEVLKEIVSIEEKEEIKKEFKVEEEKVILSIGQFIPRKGFDWMIKAYKDMNKNIGIYIIGGIPPKEYIDLKKQYNMSNLHFIDFQNKKNILKWYKIANVFVLPTREDIWGLVVNEAMGQGVPVITTDKCVAGLELIENSINGYIVNVEDKSNLLKKTNYILSIDTEEIAINNLNVMSQYTLENMVSVTYEILMNR